MTGRLVFRPAAVADLDAIWDYTANRWGTEQADAYLSDLHAVCSALARGERIAQDAAHIRPGYRKLRCGRHLVFHRGQPDGRIEIVRILHERMDVALHLAI